jgi:hypothetical protein
MLDANSTINWAAADVVVHRQRSDINQFLETNSLKILSPKLNKG